MLSCVAEARNSKRCDLLLYMTGFVHEEFHDGKRVIHFPSWNPHVQILSWNPVMYKMDSVPSSVASTWAIDLLRTRSGGKCFCLDHPFQWRPIMHPKIVHFHERARGTSTSRRATFSTCNTWHMGKALRILQAESQKSWRPRNWQERWFWLRRPNFLLQICLPDVHCCYWHLCFVVHKYIERFWYSKKPPPTSVPSTKRSRLIVEQKNAESAI
jgi:hypothetical protein